MYSTTEAARTDRRIYDGTQSYSAAGQCIWLPKTSNRPFVAIANGLAPMRGFSAPAIRHQDLDAGFSSSLRISAHGAVIGSEGEAPRTGSWTRPMRLRPTRWRRCTARRCRTSAADVAIDPTAIPCSIPKRGLVEMGADARMVHARSWRRTERGAAPTNSSRCGARIIEEAGRSTPDLGDPGFPFSEHHLAR